MKYRLRPIISASHPLMGSTIAFAARYEVSTLGDHLKTGHTLSLQNRPTEVAEDVIVLPCGCVRLQGAV
jgi:hypothetical protein